MDLGAGYVGMFVSAFLAGSVLPLPSEPVLLALLSAGADPWLSVLVASAGNLLGALTVWLMGRAIARGGGRWVGPRLTARLAGDEAGREAARERMRRWGAGLLLLSWVPWIGDPLVLGAGLVEVRLLPFLLLCGAGKLARYAALAWLWSG